MRISGKMFKAVEHELISEGTPAPGNKCKRKGCGGRAVRKVRALFRGQFEYSMPECEKCGRIYMYAKNAAKVGLAEFRKSLSKPVFAAAGNL